MKESTDDTNVGYRLTIKKNLGNYESAEVSVSLHVGCDAGDVDQAWEEAKDWVHGKVDDACRQLGISED